MDLREFRVVVRIGLRADLAKEREEHQEDVGHLNGEIVRFHGIADDLCNRLNSLGIKAAKQAGEALGMVEGEGLLCAAKRVVKERDALRAEVADLRGTFDMVHASLGIKRGDHIGKAIEALKAHTPKRQAGEAPQSQPDYKVGDWVRRKYGVLSRNPHYHAGAIGKVVTSHDGHGGVNVSIPGGACVYWAINSVEPCDPPQEASHDTPEGKRTAEGAVEPKGHTPTILRPSNAIQAQGVNPGFVSFPWRWRMTNEEMLGVAEIVERAAKRYNEQFLARTEADRKRIDGLMIQAQDMRAEIERLKKPRQHPVKVGESVRRTTEGSIAPIGTLGRVLVVWSDAYQVELRKGFSTFWAFDDCTPCDPPPEASHITPEGKQTAEGALPQPGDVVRLVREPSADTVGATLKNSLDWPWESWRGCVGDRGEVVVSVGTMPGARSVRIMNTGVKAWWPLSCIEVVKGGDK